MQSGDLATRLELNNITWHVYATFCFPIHWQWPSDSRHSAEDVEKWQLLSVVMSGALSYDMCPAHTPDRVALIPKRIPDADSGCLQVITHLSSSAFWKYPQSMKQSVIQIYRTSCSVVVKYFRLPYRFQLLIANPQGNGHWLWGRCM